MTTHSSATTREETPHTINSTRSNTLNTNTISDALKRRAQSVMNDKSIDAGARAVIRYGLETNDPWLAELVRRADAGERIIDAFDFSQMPAASGNDSNTEKIEALLEMICGAGEQPAAALLVLMATFEKSTDPKALANTVKHLTFTRCGEWNVYGMVNAQIALLEDELLAGNTLAA